MEGDELGRTNQVITERVIVRTQYTGQGLRVSLVKSRYEDKDGNWEFTWPTEEKLQAELVIEAGYRLIVGKNGLTVESLDG